MRTHPISQPVMNRANLQVNGLDRTEGALDVSKRLVVAHAVGVAHLGSGHRGTDDVDAIERRFGGDAVRPALKRECRLINDPFEMLGDLVLVDDLADAHADGVLADQLGGVHARLDLLKVCL